MNASTPSAAIAVIGLTGRFPGARNLEEFWRNLCEGRETISHFTDEELASAGVEAPKDEPRYVKARGVVEKGEYFDAAFFGMTPREAEVIDPQQRMFLECAAEALECAGCDPQRYDGLIGVFGGASINTYAINNLYSHASYREKASTHFIGLANEKDYMPARVSYKLNLRGPSMNVQTACATSLSVVCVACQNLLSHQCDVALAGGVTLTFPAKKGYWHQEGGIFSPDGHCRPFDADSKGTVLGDGCGMVVLKRLDEALADGDTIYATIHGFAITNDGAMKAGFAAPSVDGQAEAIGLALGMAGFEPRTIGYVEAHGTGTLIGDPIEVAGLNQAFGGAEHGTGYCAIGSVKSNIGHLDGAAGIAGFIKAVLTLHHRKIPPSVGYKSPNPQIDFASSPFYVSDRLHDFPRGGTPRRAGVTSLGIGGTNVHLVLEEAPEMTPAPGSARPAEVLVLSARSATALEQARTNLAERMGNLPATDFANAAHTLQLGRTAMPYRCAIVAREPAAAAAALRDPSRVRPGPAPEGAPSVAFLFPGQGSQQVNMARELFETEPVFRAEVDRCASALTPLLGFDLRDILYPAPADAAGAQAKLDQTAVTQPALFTIEYALAKTWMSWGVKPDVMLGHSLGEIVAACLSGVFSLEDALQLVCERARLMQSQPAGGMMAVRLPEAEVRPLLNGSLSLAAVNGVGACVVSGPREPLQKLVGELGGRGVGCRELRTSHAFHSAMMTPMLDPFRQFLGRIAWGRPAIPYYSNVTGRLQTAERARDPGYWTDQVRSTVRFADSVTELCARPGLIVLEVGPGRVLTSLVRQHPARREDCVAVTSLPAEADGRDVDAMLQAVGELWTAGVAVDWNAFNAGKARRRILLPTYPFERQRHWVEPAQGFSVPLEPSKERHAPAAAGTATDAACQAAAAVTTAQAGGALGRLVALMKDLSGLDLARQTGATFAELGFDSLFLAQIAAAVGREFQTRIAFRDLHGSLGSLEKLAAHLSPRSAAPDLPGAVPEPVPAEPAAMEVPLTDPQREVWLSCQVSEDASCAYNESRHLRLKGGLDLGALRQALRGLVARHEALRTTISPDGETQRVAASGELDLAVVDFSELHAGNRETATRKLAEHEIARPFDLAKGPLVRARLVRLGAEDHLLMLTVHHVVCDGHAWSQLIQDLAMLYRDHHRGTDSRPGPVMQLSTYARSQAGRSASPEAVASEQWWKQQFADGVPALELPTDHPRPASLGFGGARVGRYLGGDVRTRLRDLSASQGCTLFTTLLAAYQVWLARLSGQDDVVAGVPVAERSEAGADRVVGHCVDFLPVRVRIDGAVSFAGLLQPVREAWMDAFEHRQCSFGRILRAVSPPHDAGRRPIAPATFNLNHLGRRPAFDGLETDLQEAPLPYMNFELSFNVTDLNDDLFVECRYHTALWKAETIERWLGHFVTLVAAIGENPNRAVSELPLLTRDEETQILALGEGKPLEVSPATALEMFEDVARRSPAAVALVHDTKSVTYAELNRLADGIAARLRTAGAGPDRLVGICVDRTPLMIASLLAVWKAGGAYVPLDPAYPSERIAVMIEDGKPALILTETKHRDRIEGAGRPVLLVDQPMPEGGEAAALASAARPEGLAYVLFTSGSTGRPKGVAIEHRSVTALIAWARDCYAPEELRGVLAATSLCFDLSVFEIFVPLALGGTVVLAPDVLALSRLPAATPVSLINTVPSAMTELLRAGALPPSAHVVNLAGEPLSQELVEQLYRSPGVKRVHDLYGPTETTVYSTGTLRQAGGRATIGRPLPNECIRILDRHGRLTPPGIPGELHIGGAGLARGYLHRDELTAEKFVADPYVPGAKLYRTGDRVRMLPDGELEYQGRLDQQIKVRGFRIEPGDIEAVLRRQPSVREAVVAVHPQDPQTLVAYVAAGAVTPDELRRAAASQLPAYMVPGFVVVLDAIPRTPNGKVDRRRLPAPELVPSHAASAPESGATPTPTEAALAEIWCELLRRDRVELQDDFFALGGHSLLAMQFLVRVRDAFQVDLPLRDIFQTPTIAALARLIDELMTAGSELPPEPEPCAIQPSSLH